MNLKLALKLLWQVARLLITQLDEEQKSKFEAAVKVAEDLTKKVE